MGNLSEGLKPQRKKKPSNTLSYIHNGDEGYISKILAH